MTLVFVKPRTFLIPWTAAIFFPIFATAASSSFSRLPVMYTYAPSLTNCSAVANPIPLAAACDYGNFPLKSVQLLLLLAHDLPVSQTATLDSSTN